jgi:hypothetical protein
MKKKTPGKSSPPAAQHVLGYKEPLTQEETSTLRGICNQDLFLERVAEIAGRCRMFVQRERELPSQGEIASTLKIIKRRAGVLENPMRALAQELGELDQRTEARLRLGASHERGDPAKLDYSGHSRLQYYQVKMLEASAALVALECACAVAIGFTKPAKGRTPHAELKAAGDEVRALFRAHRIPWSVTAKRDTSSESAAVRVFRICTGCRTQRVERHLPKK